jgi:two-component system response regulator DegU
MSISILIAEDQRLLRQCFREVLDANDSIEVVATAADGAKAVTMAQKHKPDIILMDLAMPKISGTDAARTILERLPDTKILMLSLHDDSSKVREAMRVGVRGFISKDVDFEELVRIIQAIAEDSEINSPYLLDQMSSTGEELARYNLTEREVKTLKFLIRGFNNAEMAEKLCVSEQTIKKELVIIFDRLKVRNRTQAAVKGVQMGLLDRSA